eukprot:1150312-Pelagomonas_calceolata.AAC.5
MPCWCKCRASEEMLVLRGSQGDTPRCAGEVDHVRGGGCQDGHDGGHAWPLSTEKKRLQARSSCVHEGKVPILAS